MTNLRFKSGVLFENLLFPEYISASSCYTYVRFLVWLYSFSMLPPMIIALVNKERSFFVFLETFIACFILGGGAWMATKRTGIQLRTRDGFIIIVLFWLLFSTISAFPLWLDDVLHLTFADALFEGVSGITTTGATVIGDVNALPRSYLYYRAQLNSLVD